MSHLQGGKVDVSAIQKIACNNLVSLLEKCPGTKTIVWENMLAGIVGLVAPYSLLKEFSVVKMYPLRNTPLPDTPVKHVIFITRPKLHSMDLVAANVHADLKTKYGNQKQYHLFFVPKFSLLCRKRLENKGVFGSLSLMEEFQYEWAPFESDLISMEISEVFSEYHIQHDPSTLYQIAQAVISLQKVYGPIPRVWGKGPAAETVWNLVKRLTKEENLHETYKNHQGSCIDQILLIDRSTDLLTPLVTQLTYEGLIDEIFGLNSSTVEIPSDKFKSSEDKISESLAEEKPKIILNSADSLYAELRDKNFNAVGTYLSKQAKLIKAQLEDRQNKTVQEMKIFVQKLPQMLENKKLLSQHTAIAESIKEVTDSYSFIDNLQTEQEFLNCIETDKANQYIEDLIAQSAPMMKVLRLICMQCIVASGFKPKLLEYYKKEISQVYGIEGFLAVTNLEKSGLIRLQSSSRQYAVLRKTLRLTVENTSETNPTDISYVHSGYAPLSVRICEYLNRPNGWKNLQDVLGLLPGRVFDDACPVVTGGTANMPDIPKSVLVFFIGGCTFAEISALRLLSQQQDSNVEYVIATTKLINGNTFLKSIIDVDTKHKQ